MALTAEQLAYALSADTATAERLLPVAVALVDRYAPDAPEAVRDEAAIRCAGWLVDQPSAAVRSVTTGDLSTDYTPTMVSALRHSGAMGLLTFWKIRRGGAVG